MGWQDRVNAALRKAAGNQAPVAEDREIVAMIIATRVLILRTEAGDVQIPIRIHAPEPADRSWKCRYEIGWPDETFKSQGYGEDAVQAIELTFQKIGIELYVSEGHKAGKLGWNEPGAGYGFPVPKNVRDLLVGYDKQIYGDDP